jgi:hypothetical protein
MYLGIILAMWVIGLVLILAQRPAAPSPAPGPPPRGQPIAPDRP